VVKIEYQKFYYKKMTTKKNINLKFEQLNEKLDSYLTEIKSKVSINVFLEKQHIIYTQYEDKIKIFKVFLKICEEICLKKHNQNFIQKSMISIAEEQVELAKKLTHWYEKNIFKLDKTKLLDGVIIQMVNKYLSKSEEKIYSTLKQLTKSPNLNDDKKTLDKLKQLIDIVQNIDLSDLESLEKKIVSMSKELIKNKKDIQQLNQLLVKTMVLTGAESGTIYIVKGNELHFLLIFNHAMEMNSMESEKLAKKFPPLQLYNPRTGAENVRYISVYSAVKNKTINIKSLQEFKEKIKNDIQTIEDEQVGPDLYQQKTGYVGKTFLCAPIQDGKGNVIGVFQLSNRIEKDTNKIIPFSDSQQIAINKITSLAAKPLIRLLPKKSITKTFFKNSLNKVKVKNNSIQFYRQLDEMDCGPTCLKMITKYYGKEYSIQFFREKCFLTNQGVTMRGLSEAAELIGYRTIAYFISFNDIFTELLFPCIANWGEDHFIVIYKVEKNSVWIADPAIGLIKYSRKEFKEEWFQKNEDPFIAVLTLEPTPYFYHSKELIGGDKTTLNLKFIFNYLRPHKGMLTKIVIAFSLVTMFSLIPPFLIKAIVDYGLYFQNINFVLMLLAAQLMLFTGIISMTIFSSWLSFHMGKKIDFSLMSDFFNKLLKLKISFFDDKTRGDILQRISDNDRIKHFLSFTTLTSLFNIIIMIAFSTILIFFSFKIFIVFMLFTLISLFWTIFLLDKQKKLNIKLFEQESNVQSMLIEMLDGIQEIKINSIEKEIRWRWRAVKSKHEAVYNKWNNLQQVQLTGNDIINQLKNILITFLSVILVIQGEITIGIMMAIQFIIGQLNTPVSQFSSLITIIQDNSMALERLSTVHLGATETENQKHEDAPMNQGFTLQNIAFCYEGSNYKPILEHINLNIPEKTITALVGKSGAGKTTLLKLLFKFYEPTKGIIKFGDKNLAELSYSTFRSKCGVVLQDGYIFSDTIEGNICLKQEKINNQRFIEVTKIACVNEFIFQFEAGYATKVSANGNQLSKGQKQRICLARALYKNPDILFLDEATSAIDAATEKKIIANIKKYCSNLTIIIVAHRLNMIKSADQIAVLERGTVMELGSHLQLIKKKGSYYKLIKEQLDNIKM